ncbi:hypothetical protein [Sphingopyxis sp. PET50]|uniref:hypothetical protein n=1 Tax=Sphingopyxis sp. PET50 TaxID=2976533 RepID=UPI0021B03C5A|nr:hypothetical protein [Sphingopyxis sp. PET50]
MIELPDGVVPNYVKPTLIDFGGVLRPPLGGPIQRINRLGNRYRVDVGLPPIENHDLGRVVVSRLLRAKTEGLRIEWQLVGVDQGSPGFPVVDGPDQAGAAIQLKGIRTGYGASEGYWLSIESGGQHYLYCTTAPAKEDGSGGIELGLVPHLRVSPGDEDAVHLQKPMIEGLVVGDEWSWDYSLEHHVGIQFSIEEAA